MERKRLTSATAKSDLVKTQVLDFIKQGYSVKKAMDAVGRSVKTYEYYRKVDPQFAEAVDRLRSMVQRGEHRDPVEVPPFEEFSMKYLGTQVFPHQMQWVDLLEGRDPQGLHPSQVYEPGEPEMVIVNTPPNHAKSTTITMNYVTYRICQNPNVRILIVSKTQALAQKFLLGVKNRLTHPKYQEMQLKFGPPGGFDSNSDSWKQEMIYVSGDIRDSGEKDPTVQAIGIRGHIYGARADLIIMDDCVDGTNAHEYEKQIDWVQSEVFSRIDDGGKLLVVGTRLRPKDLYSELRDPLRYPDEVSPWTYLSQPAVLEFDDNPKNWVTLWPKTNLPPVGIVQQPDENGMYPKWDGPALFKRRARMSPNMWAMVYQQQQVHEDSIFPIDMLKSTVNAGRQAGLIPRGMPSCRPNGMDGLIVIAGFDPAGAGYSAATVIGLDLSDQKRYILDVHNQAGMTPDGIRDLFKRWTEKYKISEWRVEKNALQTMITQDREIRENLANYGSTLREHHTGANKWDADFGVASLATLFSGWKDGRALVEFPSTYQSEGVKALVEQLSVWYPGAPKTQKTDCVMSFWFAELACRDRIQAINSYQRSHVKNPFLTRYDKDNQYSVNVFDIEDKWQTINA